MSQNTSLPIVTDDIVEKLHDMTEDIMDLATMQMDFSGLQPYRLKRPVRLASSDMLRQWDRRIEHKRLKEHSATAMFSRELHLSPTSPEDARSSFYNNSPRNAAYGAYQHAKAGHVRLADYSYQLETEEEIDPHEDFTASNFKVLILLQPINLVIQYQLLVQQSLLVLQEQTMMDLLNRKHFGVLQMVGIFV